MSPTRPDLVSATALASLPQIFAARGDHMAAAAVGPPEVLRILLAWGVLQEAGVLDGVVCDACERGHFARVERTPEGGAFGWVCPDAGFIPTTLDRVRQVRIDRLGVVKALAAGLTHRGATAPLGETGSLWRLGRLLEGTRRIELVLSIRAPAADAMEEWRRAAAAVGPVDLGVVLSAAAVSVGAVPFPGWRAVPLSELLTLGPEGHPEIDDGELKRLVAAWLPTSASASTGRPGRFGETASVVEHCLRTGVAKSLVEVGPKLVADHWGEVHPDGTPPSRSTVKSHLSRLREQKPASL